MLCGCQLSVDWSCISKKRNLPHRFPPQAQGNSIFSMPEACLSLSSPLWPWPSVLYPTRWGIHSVHRNTTMDVTFCRCPCGTASLGAVCKRQGSVSSIHDEPVTQWLRHGKSMTVDYAVPSVVVGLSSASSGRCTSDVRFHLAATCLV